MKPLRPTTEQLQRYLNSNVHLHESLDIPLGQHLALQPLAQGEYNANYLFQRPADGKKFLLRVNMGSQMHLDNQISYEMDALRLLAPSGRTPRVYYTDDTKAQLPCGVGVEEWLPGKPLCYETDLSQAACILADIHAVPVAAQNCHLIAPAFPLGAIVEECEAMFGIYRSWPQADQDVIALVDNMFEHAQNLALHERENPKPVHRCIVNTEVNSHNFLINNDGPSYLIDWEKPLLSEPAQDLGHFLVPTTTYWKTDTWLTNQQIEHFLNEYLLAVDDRFPTHDIQEKLDAYLTVTCLRGITWCAMAYTEYVDENRAMQNADTFLKIKEYVSSEFIEAIRQQFYS